MKIIARYNTGESHALIRICKLVMIRPVFVLLPLLCKILMMAAILDLCKLDVFPPLGFFWTFSMSFWGLHGILLELKC